jgi:tRNA(fMet)-specific endonuclease VapC
MLTYLLDTDICIYAMKGRSISLAEKFKANDGRVALPDVTLFEFLCGAEKYAEPAARLAVTESFAARLNLLPFDSRAAQHAGQIRAALERTGQSIGAYDLMIAGIARSQGLMLVTNNIREFGRVEELCLDGWK